MGFFDRFRRKKDKNNSDGINTILINKKNNEIHNDDINVYDIFKKEDSFEPSFDAKTKNFKYLEDLIQESNDKLILDFDIILDDAEELAYGQGIDLKSVKIIDGNNHFIDARGKTPIFSSAISSAYTFKNIIFRGGFSKDGGVISCFLGSVNFENCTFEYNQAERGGAIFFKSYFNNSGKFSVNFKDCTFKCNHANDGGVIYIERFINDKVVDFKFLNCSFISNSAKDTATIVNAGRCTIIESSFIGNNSDAGCVLNNIYTEDVILNSINIVKCIFKENSQCINNGGYLEVYDSKFINNLETEFFQDKKDAQLFINNSSISSSHNQNCVFLDSGLANISYTKFENENGEFLIYSNNANVKIQKFKSDKTPFEKRIYNNGNLDIKIFEKEKNGVVIYSLAQENNFDYIHNQNGFEDLEKLINESSNELLFNEDFILQSHEQEFYEGGIELCQDGLVIDGQNHIIDANNLSRIFYITGRDITLKNIIFKNGKYFYTNFILETSGGATISTIHDTSITIINCKFIENYSDVSGGSIANKGDLTIKNSIFDKNFAINYGGAIYNNGSLDIYDTDFRNNNGYTGGAIYNDDFIYLNTVNFENNIARFQAGAILNKSNLKAIDCDFKKNSAQQDSGGAINNTANECFGESSCYLNSCNFIKNTAVNSGAIRNNSHIPLIIQLQIQVIL